MAVTVVVDLATERQREDERGTPPLVRASGGRAPAFRFNRRKKIGKGTSLNLSKSGASISKKLGPVTLNSRGKGSLRLGKGKSFRF